MVGLDAPSRSGDEWGKVGRAPVASLAIPARLRIFLLNHISLVRLTLMELLKLIALDDDDLKVLSANLQDAVLRVEDMAFIPRERRFAAVLSRFDWLSAVESHTGNGGGYERRRCALRFEKVLSAQHRSLALDIKSDSLELLAIGFEPAESPSGHVTLYFAGGGAIRLEVDCIEAELRDLGPTWKTPLKPDHPDDNTDANTTS